MVVYLDTFIGMNFLVDLCLLLGVNRLSGHPPGIKRAAAAAAVGGGYAGMCLVPRFGFLASNLWRLVSLGVMSMAAFGLSRSAWTRGVLFVLLSMALGGLALNVEQGSVWGLLLCAGALAALCQVGFRGKAQCRELLPAEVTYRGKTVRFLALRDTGNTLRDPLTGETVLVAAPEIGRKLGLSASQLRDPVGALAPGMRLIPCGTVGGSGLLAAVRCDSVRIGGKTAGTLVAFGREEFENRDYQALTGGQYG